ncbi:hypothetical protein [Singulisphaera acidiphila]|uniref:Uncharacterized protein n=1 Tax=Singulisphaera acidiphila (strain ATCC BAA-1392 / DSM 18658 / VKM B-2454 / MOB10) TaxID=886293 RepID=L0DPV5_SINAD|nr:hypothetical protein [Singulisphaera acidiphila]AGA31287.1 hypothetical protein Sinac_7240 [Singulisphaera acidiphila DSM 18658]
MGLVVSRYALNYYSQTGHAPPTPRWQMLAGRMELNSSRFTSYHPTLAPLLTDAKCIGMLPGGKFYNELRVRYAINPQRFTHYHPFLGKLLERDANAREHCANNPIHIPSEPPSVSPETLVPPTTPPVTPPTQPPEPYVPPTDPGTNPGTTVPTDPTDPVTTVPEPATAIQFGIGLICIGVYTVFKRKKNAYLKLAPIS